MRPPSLRQIEAFRAFIEAGTVSRAAELLRISQPAASKLLIHLEEDTGLQLFERESGRLALTDRGMRLYEEIDRIFSGVDQIARAVEQIRREDRGRLQVGVMPGLSGKFVSRVVSGFLEKHPNVHVSVDTRASQFIAEWLVTRQLDVGILTTMVDQTHLASVSLIEEPFVCIMPLGHPLTRLKRITPSDLEHQQYITFGAGSLTRRRVEAAFEEKGVPKPVSVLEATTAPNICEFVAAGLGVSIVHPLMVESVKERVAVRPFDPPIPSGFQICRPHTARNSALVDVFIEEAQAVARASLDEMFA